MTTSPQAPAGATSDTVHDYLLVVDDEPAIRRLVQLMLSRHTYAVQGAGDGREALEVAVASPPALVLLDMHMPVMDGWEFLDAYEKLQGQRAKVVIFSSRADDLEESVRKRAVAVLQKPVMRETLLAVVQAHWCPLQGS